MKKKLTRKEQAQATKRKIYQSAIELIQSKGYENVSIEDIAQRANTAKGTFYLYFKSKQDLIYHTIQMYDEIAENAYQKIKDLPTFEEQLIGYLYFANAQVQTIGDKILNALLGHNLTETNKFLTVEKRAIYQSLQKIIQKGYVTGELSKEYDIAFYTEIIVIFIQGLDYYWCNADNKFNYVQTSEREARIFVKGLIELYGAKS